MTFFLTPRRECIRIYFKTFCFLRKHRNPRTELKQVSGKQEPAGTSFRSFCCCIAPHPQTVVLSRSSGCLLLCCRALNAASVSSLVCCRHHNGFLTRNIPIPLSGFRVQARSLVDHNPVASKTTQNTQTNENIFVFHGSGVLPGCKDHLGDSHLKPKNF